MKISLFYKLFPTPNFLRIPALGIDISDKSIKYVELNGTASDIKLGRYGEIKIPAGIINSGKIENKTELVKYLKDLKSKLDINFIRMTLPEEQLYVVTISILKVKPEQIRNSIELVIEDFVPLPITQIIFDYDLIKETETNYILQVVAVSNMVVQSYMDLCDSATLSPTCFELEGTPLARALVPKGTDETFMIIDFGEARTGIIITTEHKVLFTATVAIGGSALTSLIAKNYNLNFEEAEKMKRSFGMARGGENREMFNAMIGGISVLKDEIQKHYEYWNNHKDETGAEHPKIKEIILSGGNSNLIGLAEYLNASLKTTIKKGNVWININTDPKFIPEMTYEESLSYATAIGLTLGSFEVR